MATSVRRPFIGSPPGGNDPACLCQVSTPDALIQRKAIAQAPFIFWTRANETPRAPVNAMPPFGGLTIAFRPIDVSLAED
jgi:hypothetical protein